MAVVLFYGYQLLLVVGGWLEVVLYVLLLFVFGLVLSFRVQPVVDMLQRQLRLPRSAAILTVLGTLLVAVVGAL